MKLHIIYRSHSGENSKHRPELYSKRLCLLSFCRALQHADDNGAEVEVIFLCDGPIPDARLELMTAWGTPLFFTGGSNRRSYLRALRLPAEYGWASDDLVLLAEDDYLWTPNALTALLEGASTSRADYLAPYSFNSQGNDAVRWIPQESTTSTFAARAGLLRQDYRLLVLCSLSGGDFDHTTCLTLQGRARFHLRELIWHSGAAGSGAAQALLRSIYLTVMKTAVNLRSLRRASHRRVLLAAEPPLATHMEVGLLAPGNWDELARQTQEWAPCSSGPRHREL